MRIDVIGCHGGELLGFRPCCFRADHKLLLDAGSMCQTLSFDELVVVDDILVSHTHLDHVKDLGLLADMVVGSRDRPIEIHGTEEVIGTIRECYFNDRIWPDFTKIPTPDEPVIRLNIIEPMAPYLIGGFQVLGIPVNHPVETCGFLLEKDGVGFVYSGDTGPTELLWEVVNSRKHIKGMLLDVSFPNDMQWLGDVSGHLTPNSARAELSKLDDQSIPVWFYHLKPVFNDQVWADLAPLLGEGRSILELDQSLVL